MMDGRLIGFRIPGAVVERLDAMAQATGRNRSEVARYFLATACPDALPASWFETAEVQRIVTGQSDPGTRGAA
jgi:predicted transcriptional regulator